jgi:hypothetical protein
MNFSRQIFEESLNIKFHQNPSSGSCVVLCRQTDGHDEANSRFSKFGLSVSVSVFLLPIRCLCSDSLVSALPLHAHKIFTVASRNSSVFTVARRPKNRGSVSGKVKRYFCSQSPDQRWNLPEHLVHVSDCYFPEFQASGQSVWAISSVWSKV